MAKPKIKLEPGVVVDVKWTSCAGDRIRLRTGVIKAVMEGPQPVVVAFPASRGVVTARFDPEVLHPECRIVDTPEGPRFRGL
jgi:hypothetical protein